MEIKNTLLRQTGTYQNLEATNGAAARRAGQQSPQQASAAQGDKVSVSPEALLRTQAHKAISNSPEVRQEKVDSIKERVNAGTYSVDSKNIAQKLVQDEAFLAGTLER